MFQKQILQILFIVCPVISEAQNNVEVLNDGVEGHHILYYSNGKKEIEFDVTNGKINGQVLRYYRNGKVKDTRDVANDKYNGYVTIYNKRGQVCFLQITRNDSLIAEVDSGYGLFRKRFYSRWYWNREADNNLEKISPKNKKPFDKFWEYYGYVPAINGTQTLYYKSGTTKKIMPRVDGMRHGEWKWFNKEGMMTKSRTYEMGKRIK